MPERTTHLSQKASFMWDNISNLDSDLIWGLHTAGSSAVWKKTNSCSNISPLHARVHISTRNYTHRTKCILALHKKCSQNLLDIRDVSGHKFGTLNIVPHLGNLASNLKRWKPNYDSSTVMATSVSNTMLMHLQIAAIYIMATESLFCATNSYSEHLKKEKVINDLLTVSVLT